MKTLQRLLDGWWRAAVRREVSWLTKEAEAHLRWTQAVYAVKREDRDR